MKEKKKNYYYIPRVFSPQLLTNTKSKPIIKPLYNLLFGAGIDNIIIKSNKRENNSFIFYKYITSMGTQVCLDI